MEDVRSDSRICIIDSSGTIKTVIAEEDFERSGYKSKGWTVIKEDWTLERIIKPPVDISKEMGLNSLASNSLK